MSEITTVYPTSGLADRSFNSIMTAFYNCITNIPAVTDFFDSVVKIGDETKTSYSDHKIELTKGQSVLRIMFYNGDAELEIVNNSTTDSSKVTPRSKNTKTNDISVSFVTGKNGTAAVWLDDLSKEICMVFGEFDNKVFIANSSSASSTALYYSDSGTAVNTLSAPFNGSNIGSSTDYIAQPYYHLGINTGDIYTFDGGTENIPWGIFNIDNAEFVRLTSNFALRLQ